LELRDALATISEIRGQIAKTEVFRGYKSVPVAASGVIALGAGLLQPTLVGEPTRAKLSWLFLWVGTAAVSIGLSAVEMAWRYRRNTSVFERARIWFAVRRFLPAVAAGGLVTLALGLHARESLYLLPGLWATFMSLGIFASMPVLPRPVAGVGAFYLLAGTCCFVFAKGEHAFSPLAMALTFGVGQLYAAAVLRLTLERGESHD
jgi:hypothetical protein